MPEKRPNESTREKTKPRAVKQRRQKRQPSAVGKLPDADEDFLDVHAFETHAERTQFLKSQGFSVIPEQPGAASSGSAGSFASSGAAPASVSSDSIANLLATKNRVAIAQRLFGDLSENKMTHEEFFTRLWPYIGDRVCPGMYTCDPHLSRGGGRSEMSRLSTFLVKLHQARVVSILIDL